MQLLSEENVDTCIIQSPVSVCSYIRSVQYEDKVKPSVNPAVDWVCMDGWSVWPCALLQNEETVRPVNLQQHHKMRARSVALNTSHRTSSPLMI